LGEDTETAKIRREKEKRDLLVRVVKNAWVSFVLFIVVIHS
jgi:hypothetical protein